MFGERGSYMLVSKVFPEIVRVDFLPCIQPFTMWCKSKLGQKTGQKLGPRPLNKQLKLINKLKMIGWNRSIRGTILGMDDLPSLKLTFLPLKMDSRKTILSFWDDLFSGANCLFQGGYFVTLWWTISCPVWTKTLNYSINSSKLVLRITLHPWYMGDYGCKCVCTCVWMPTNNKSNYQGKIFKKGKQSPKCNIQQIKCQHTATPQSCRTVLVAVMDEDPCWAAACVQDGNQYIKIIQNRLC